MIEDHKKFIRPLGAVASNGENKIYVRYTYDLNLLELSDRIIKYLDSEKILKVPQINVKIKELEERIKTPQFKIGRSLDLKTIKKLNSKKEEILSGEKQEEFLLETKDLLKSYEALGTITSKNIFGIEESPINEDESKSFKRNLIISRYLEICKDYVPIEIEKKYTPKYACAECGYDLEESTGPNETSETTCPNCGLTSQIFKQYISSKDGESSDYEDRENYLKGIYRFQGKQKVSFPDNFFKELDSFFISRGLPTGEAVRSMDKIDGRRGQEGIIGKKILRRALAAKGYNNHYDDINLITYEYWNWDLPDITDLEEILLNDYDKTEKILKQIKGNKRKATINTQWRLKHHLEARGYKVRKDDFKIVETREIQEMYEGWWKTMCTEAGITYIKTL